LREISDRFGTITAKMQKPSAIIRLQAFSATLSGEPRPNYTNF
jgi:hypothetical protein